MTTALAAKVAQIDDWYDEQAEQARLLQIFDARYVAMLRAVHALVGEVLGLDDFRLDDAATRRVLREAAERVVRIDETTRAAIARRLQEGQAMGLSNWELANGSAKDEYAGIEGLFRETWNGRAETVARTELAHSQNIASLDRYAATGIVDEVRIIDGDQDQPCSSRNGKVVPLGTRPGLLHPNCLVAGQMVVAPNLRGATSREFGGEVVVLRTADDQFLTCTPNHPVLTAGGWVAAGLLREGDYVVRSLDSERVQRWLDPDHDYRPSLIEDVADAIGPSFGGSAATVPGSAEQFHGDGADGDVHVVRADSFSKSSRVSALLKPPSQLAIIRGDVAPGSLASLRLEAEGFPGLPLTAPRDMGGRGVGLPFGAGKASHAQARSLGHGPRDAVLSQPRAHGTRGFAQLGGNHRGTHGALVEHGAQDGFAGVVASQGRVVGLAEQTMKGGGSYPGLSGDGGDFPRGLVAPVQIVEVQRRQFSGHVYNLETVQGWYITNGSITHNCTVLVIPIVREGV